MAKTRTKKNANKRVVKGTLDQKHTEKINKFENMSKALPKKKEKLKKHEAQLEELMSLNPNKFTHENIRRKSYLMDSIKNLKEEINSIENCSESLDYIVNTLPILVNYYDNGDIVDDDKEELISEAMADGKKNILSYFFKETSQQENSSESNNDIVKNGTGGSTSKRKKIQPSNRCSGSKTGKVTETKPRLSRAKLYDNYLNVTDPHYRKSVKKSQNVCSVPDCDGEKILNQNDGYMVCKKCGFSEPILLTTDKPNYKEPTQDSGTYAYKRINHLTEILSQLQAKESTDIPNKVYEAIKRELKKRKIDKNDLDIFRLRRILKKLNYRKFYEHVPHILQVINGKEPPNFSRADEMKIKALFKSIQKPFAIYCPKNRKNFLNYSYVLHKFCELLELDEYTNYFPLLKNNAKLLQHDKIWKNICDYQGWYFYKSL
ncbi:putative transcription factor [Acanthamoeba castellanii mimivirus]|uniref:Putative transcription factor R429 n=5 Tax=Mimivirus TaxID=315393 RepID=YR429_MIMIV|nr:putative transcription factor [Acanthamoeba polyphaga mimivirus]Q5UQM6.1 RecName: Full=Putative transcription factor R429 [Acanthamoeba polyphaga mimivirus]AHA45434.1 putative transcription factor [Hirudovirus strain Sangsue]AHJ40119.1 transcription factor [Samba virus]ALR84019.1 putative transcription factor [Niemeyer virus]AMZ02873.1 putative transcription factor [Mimivirus Bombay]QTF49341.1 putative transcription factor [Mimivirus reunion]WMV61784.1 putative transcription factor [Mimiv